MLRTDNARNRGIGIAPPAPPYSVPLAPNDTSIGPCR